MNIYGTPPAVISLREAAEAAEMSEDDFLEALAANGLQPVIVSSQKLGVRPADLERASAVALVNSLRGWRPVVVVPVEEAAASGVASAAR